MNQAFAIRRSRATPAALRVQSLGILFSLLIGLVLPFGGRAQTNGTAEPFDAATCPSLVVLDFITDAEGKNIRVGDPLALQYRLWGVEMSGTVAGSPADLQMVELSSDTGPVNGAGITGGRAGTVTLQLNNLLSVQAVELVGLSRDGGEVAVFDQSGSNPARVPLTAARAGTLRAVELASLGAATRVDVALPAQSALARVVLCPESLPKQFPKNNFPRVEMSATARTAMVAAGETVTVDAVVKNPGGSVGFDLTAHQQLPPGLVFADDGATERIWDLGAIGANGSFSFSYDLRGTADAASGILPAYVVATISNGRGADGAASAALKLTGTPGRVLGARTEVAAPPAPPQRVVQAPVIPVTPPVAPGPAVTPVVKPPAEKPAADETENPIGGEAEAAAEGELPSEGTTTTIGEGEEDNGATTEKPEVTPDETFAFTTSTATTTAFATSCTSWLWLLGLINAVLIVLLAMQERKTSGEGQSKWVVAMLLAAVPLIIWYPACELVWWLVVTGAGTGAWWYVMASKKASGSSSQGVNTPGPSVPPAGKGLGS